MQCPECNTYYADMLSHCPNCGAPAPSRKETKKKEGTEVPTGKPVEEHPQLGRKMMAFIITGILVLVAFFTFQYIAHRNDPDYFRTLIDPDTTLADRDEVHFEKAPIDTAAAAKEEAEAKRAAENMYNSIRRQAESEEAKEEASSETTTETENASQSEAPAPAAEAAPATPAPKVEAIE